MAGIAGVAGRGIVGIAGGAGDAGRAGVNTGGGSGTGAAAGARGAAAGAAGAATGAAAGRGAGAAAAAAGAAALAPAALTANTLLHTAQRARTPPAGTLAGSTRYTVPHDEHVTFTRPASHASELSSPSWSRRRSTTYTDPGCVLAKLFISVASSLTCAGCANLRCWFVTMPMDSVINGTRWS